MPSSRDQTLPLKKQRIVSEKVLSIMMMLLWALSFTVAMSLAKVLSRNIHSLMIVFLRCSFGLVFFLPFAAKEGVKALRTRRPLLHGLRVVFVCGAMICTYYAYRNLPLATASAVGFASPLFITLLAFLILGDTISPQRWLAILAGYGGVLIILRPFSFHFNGAVYVALLANLLASCSIIVAKRLSSTESTVTIMFYTNIATFLLSAFAVSWVWETPLPRDILLLAGIGLAGTLSQFLYIEALKLGNPSFLAPFEYTRLLFAVAMGLLFFNEIPDSWVLMGAFLIILATLYLSWEGRDKSQRLS